jgi:hypothetical protein
VYKCIEKFGCSPLFISCSSGFVAFNAYLNRLPKYFRGMIRLQSGNSSNGRSRMSIIIAATSPKVILLSSWKSPYRILCRSVIIRTCIAPIFIRPIWRCTHTLKDGCLEDGRDESFNGMDLASRWHCSN